MKDVEKIDLRVIQSGSVLPVKVVPGASRDRIAGVLGDCLKIATSAPPEKGKANAAVAKIIAKAMGIDANAVAVVSGATNPRKELLLRGLPPEVVRQKLEQI